MQFKRFAFLLASFAVCSYSLVLSAEDLDGYQLSTDDQISVTVFNEPELNLSEVRISTSGSISMPLIGQVNIANLSVSQAESKIESMFRQGYLKKPNVTVSVIEYRPFYIGGEVQRPGSYPYRKGLTIQKAVTIAGGFTERASVSGISLENEEDNRIIPKASFVESVKPGDVIMVSESFF